jgi:(4S)-4-hydroxy-5-phosphonooxypentane-2,3-dione isomerase
VDRRLVILVEFELHPGSEPEFRRLVLENAAASLRDEPGCRQFDVLTPEAGPGDRIVLYEIYDDAASFDAHLATPHFATFNDATAPLVANKTVHRLGFASPP